MSAQGIFKMITLCVPGLLLNEEWIPPIRVYSGAGRSLSEILLSLGSSIFPGYHVSEFDLTLAQNLEEPVAVDLALVSKDLQAWYLLFVEPIRDVHVESLIARLQIANGHPFGIREANEIVRQMPEIDLDQARILVHDNPRLVIVTDDPRHDLSKRISSANVDVDVMIAEPFLYDGKYVIRINGDAPTQTGVDVIGTCVYHPTISNCLKVTWNNQVAVPDPGPVILRYGEIDTEWDLLLGNPTWQLQSTGTFPIKDSPPLDIVRATDGTLSIRKSSN